MKKGFTLTEIVFSIALLVLVWLTATEVIVISKVSGFLAKHKTQAIYIAQRAMEELHRKSFSQVVSGTSTVSIDTRGTPDDYSDDLTGIQIITVTNPSVYYKKAAIEIVWNENLPGTTKSTSTACASFITNDPQVN